MGPIALDTSRRLQERLRWNLTYHEVFGVALSIKVTSRVWEKSNQRGSDLLLLLALGDRSDDDGISWPGIEELSFKTRVDFRQVKRMIKHVESAGELFVLRGSGRGHSSRYFVTSGLESQAIQKTLERRLQVPPLVASNLAVDLERRQTRDQERVTSTPPFARQQKREDPAIRVSFTSPFPAIKSDISAEEKVTSEVERVTPEAQKGDISGREIPKNHDAATLLESNHHEPPCESSHEPSHTQGVCVGGTQKSRFDYPTCERFAEQRRGVINPGGYAMTIWRSGEMDELIAKWLAAAIDEPRNWREFYRTELSSILRDLRVDDARRTLVESALAKIDGSFEAFRIAREQLLDEGFQVG